MENIDIAFLLAEELNRQKAKNIEIFDVRKKTNQTEFFVFCTLPDTFKTKSIAQDIVSQMEQNNKQVFHMDGQTKGVWIVLDFGEIIVHIFTEGARERYSLEKLWRDAKTKLKFKPQKEQKK